MSKVHVATSSPRLRRFLHERKLDRLSSLLAERGLLQGEWLAEHAAMQLSESSRCASEPRWVAWRSPCRSDDAADGGSSPRIVLLWAEDARAARRAVLALDLRRACPVRVLLPRGHLEELSRLLLGLDPAATVEAELEGGRGEGGAVRYALVVQACVDDGHNVSWGGAVDRYTGVPDLLRAIRASCACC
ncbi:hypothetical protein EMIHUDRAFT_226509 [Emiliania huxleyi CCMP1516]|uniref:Uncharacterized protein n=2 Tax=Emiliania huxleyi TaxID=2903 RepID=A0A0D3KL14_EMIH1|nr:hypothetical protein EMIHUDRAFT_214576 [Emiliania huxleyi CCMP1516]XP_005788878.1 hypothetical protein EMIHUDRAFT_226509 [Emiliania huxleyi CCMP1516]EOD11291.1 hypothetical protein EMIHUDRAFT_214576 [Emiliania huxleyi CCMP1516]EOD36449.1 hypothetical protein EMIHUDRAFT_226509 [Emiliania huxleyi CCMP1516]|eukprot:XP_005763720.1 hypothetical protein EMIHUDRAFT_214576 [Emiliania huxleyi CCMP1516]